MEIHIDISWITCVRSLGAITGNACNSCPIIQQVLSVPPISAVAREVWMGVDLELKSMTMVKRWMGVDAFSIVF